MAVASPPNTNMPVGASTDVEHAARIAAWMQKAAPVVVRPGAAVQGMDVVSWARRYYYIPGDGVYPRTIQLMPHQEIILKLFFSGDAARLFGCAPYFQTLVYSTVKKSGKTAIAGLVARWIAETWGSHSEVYSLANDLEQSRGRIYAAAIASIELDPRYDRKAKGIPGEWRIIDNHALYIPTNGVLKAVASDYKGEAGSNPVATFWCVAGETEVLTSEGWVRADTLTEAHRIATLSPAGLVAYERPAAVNKQPYSGDMIRFSHRRAEFLVTPNHRVFGKSWTNYRYKKQSDWGFQEAGFLASGGRAGGELRGNSDGLESPVLGVCDEARGTFWGYYISEGFTSGYHNRDGYQVSTVHIAQDITVHPETFGKIGASMRAVGLKARATSSGWAAVDHACASYLKQVYGYSHERFIPDFIKYAPVKVQRAFLTAYLEGNGWANPTSDGYQCCTVSKQLADDLMQVGMHAGYHPRLMSVRPGKTPNSREMYRLSFSVGPIGWGRKTDSWSGEHYEGTVVCPSLKHGTFFIRYNGKTCWTGNSELWGYSSRDARRLWTELTPVPTRERSVRYVETYAGYENESSILNDLEDRIKDPKQSRRLTHEDLAYCGLEWPWLGQELPFFVNIPSRTLAYWDEGVVARRMPWQTPAYYEAQAVDLRQADFERLHENKRVTSVDTFMPVEWWDACADITMPPVSHTQPIVLGADASVSSDCMALVGVTRDTRAGRGSDILQRLLYSWEPTRGHPLNYSLTLEPTIRRLCTGHIHPRHESCTDHSLVGQLGVCVPGEPYNIVQIAYDPYQLHDMMTRLTGEGIVWCRPFSQMEARMVADKALYDLVRDRRLTHTGDYVLRQHIANAAAKSSPSDNTRMRIVKKAEGSKIDAVVALSMAVSECLRLSL